jgi:antitoxin YefM
MITANEVRFTLRSPLPVIAASSSPASKEVVPSSGTIRSMSMREISAHEFRSHLREAVEKVVEDHVPLRVKRRGGQDFVVVSAADWEQEQETLYVLQNKSLMAQIERSLKTHREGTGYRPSAEELDALDRV